MGDSNQLHGNIFLDDSLDFPPSSSFIHKLLQHWTILQFVNGMTDLLSTEKKQLNNIKGYSLPTTNLF